MGRRRSNEWSDVEALAFAPRQLNCKPSRVGLVRRLFDFYVRCAEAGIALYGNSSPRRAERVYRSCSHRSSHAHAPTMLLVGWLSNVTAPVAGSPPSPLSIDAASQGF